MEIAIGRKSKQHESIALTADQKYAVVIMPLAQAVTQADYPALKAAIQAVPGIQDGVRIIIDGRTPASLPDGKEFFLVTRCQLRVCDSSIDG